MVCAAQVLAVMILFVIFSFAVLAYALYLFEKKQEHVLIAFAIFALGYLASTPFILQLFVGGCS